MLMENSERKTGEHYYPHFLQLRKQSDVPKVHTAAKHQIQSDSKGLLAISSKLLPTVYHSTMIYADQLS